MAGPPKPLRKPHRYERVELTEQGYQYIPITFEEEQKISKALFLKRLTVSTRTINVTFGLALLITWFAFSGKWN